MVSPRVVYATGHHFNNGGKRMGEEQLTTFQKQQLKWLKQQVSNLKSLRHTRDAYPNLERDLFAAREELDDYVAKLKKAYGADT